MPGLQGRPDTQSPLLSSWAEPKAQATGAERRLSRSMLSTEHTCPKFQRWLHTTTTFPNPPRPSGGWGSSWESKTCLESLRSASRHSQAYLSKLSLSEPPCCLPWQRVAIISCKLSLMVFSGALPQHPVCIAGAFLLPSWKRGHRACCLTYFLQLSSICNLVFWRLYTMPLSGTTGTGLGLALLFLIKFFFLKIVLCTQGWLWTHYVEDKNPELLIFLHLSFKCQNYKRVPPQLVHVVLRLEPRSSCKLSTTSYDS